MRNGERCGWCFDNRHAPPARAQPVLRTQCSCYLSQMSHVVSHTSCPLSSAHVTCVIIQLPSSCRTLGAGFVSVVSHIFNLICVSVVSICITSLSLFSGVRDLVSFSFALLSNMSDRGTRQHTCIGHKRGVKQKNKTN